MPCRGPGPVTNDRAAGEPGFQGSPLDRQGPLAAMDPTDT